MGGGCDFLKKLCRDFGYSDKGEGSLIDTSLGTSLMTTVGCISGSAVLLSATACACFLQYTLATRREGRKAANLLDWKMLCPCSWCNWRQHERASGMVLDPDSEDESDDDDSDEERSSSVRQTPRG